MPTGAWGRLSLIAARAATDHRSRIRRVPAIAAIMMLVLVVAPAAWGAQFLPGRFVVRGGPLLKAGRVSAGRSLSVFARPVAVSVDGCGSRGSSVRVGRRSVAVAVALQCAGVKGMPRLVATIRGAAMTGTVTLGKRVRKFAARRVAEPGVLLGGRARSKALGSVRNTNRLVRHPASEVSRSGRSEVLRTELVVEFASGASVSQVNAALGWVGGRIEMALSHSPLVVVSIPDPGSLAVLDALRTALARMPGIRRVQRSLMPALDASATSLPPEFASPPTAPEADAIAHLLAMRMPAAWNARAAIQAAARPLVLVADVFGDGPLDRHVAVDPFSPSLQSIIPNCPLGTCFHGYHVTGIVAGDFAYDFSPAGLVTGVFPLRSRFLPLDGTGDSLLDITDALQQTLELEPGHVVVNTSLGQHGGLFPDDARTLGSLVAGNVRSAGLEGRVFQATSAGNDGIGASDNSPWAAAALRADLFDASTGHPIAPLHNTIVVENNDQSGPPDYRPTCRWDGLIEPSNFGGNVSADGVNVYSNLLGSAAGPASGTSMSSPQVAGLAEYLWSIAPTLTPAQLVSTIENTAVPASGCGGPGAPHVDAYAATLSLDQPGCFTAACAPVRFAILDQNGDGRFDQLDLKAFADNIFPSSAPTGRDWSRYDLNGDGFTGGDTKAPFDLDTTGSTRAGAPSLGTVTQTVHDTTGNPVELQLDEQKVTDADVLCYYAYSSLYTPSATNDQRDEILGNHCGAIEIKSCSTNTDLIADASVQSDTTGGPHKTGGFIANPPGCSPPIAASGGPLTASDSGTCMVPTQQPCSASSSAQATADASGSVHGGGATINVAFTGKASALINTGGSSRGDSDGDAGVSLQVNTTCSYSVSGSVGNSQSGLNSSASLSVNFGGGSGTLFTLADGSDAKSGTLVPGTYVLRSGGVADAGAGGSVPSGDATVDGSGSLTLTC